MLSGGDGSSARHGRVEFGSGSRRDRPVSLTTCSHAFTSSLTFAGFSIRLEGKSYGAAAAHPSGRVFACPVTAAVVHGAGLCSWWDKGGEREEEVKMVSAVAQVEDTGGGHRRTCDRAECSQSAGCDASCCVLELCQDTGLGITSQLETR